MINDIMSINEKIVKLAEIKEENPAEFERIGKRISRKMNLSTICLILSPLKRQ